MHILSGIQETRDALRDLRKAGGAALRPQDTGSLGFVPTMGALHAGHRALVEAARQRCSAVVVSIFVNPTQFAPNEDFSRYPRTLDDDCRMLQSAGVDLVFTPSAETMYPPGASTFVDVEEVGGRLDGASRPGHFRGVATVVSKLFHIVQPDFAFFGQKDAAQVAVLRRMVRDLNFPVTLVVCPTVREADGLALSSRNRYLSPQQRLHALSLSRALQAAALRAQQGETNADRLAHAMRSALQQEPSLRIDYVAVVDADSLLPVADVRHGALLAVAAYVGNTRLIDNLLLPPARGDAGISA